MLTRNSNKRLESNQNWYNKEINFYESFLLNSIVQKKKFVVFICVRFSPKNPNCILTSVAIEKNERMPGDTNSQFFKKLIQVLNKLLNFIMRF